MYINSVKILIIALIFSGFGQRRKNLYLSQVRRLSLTLL